MNTASKMAKRQRSALTVERALELLFDEDEEEDTAERADVIIVPPDVDELTDEEDIAEDEMGEISVQDVPGTLEVHVDRVPIEEHAENKAKAATSSRKKRKFCDSEPVWKHKTPEYRKVKGRSEHHRDCLQKMKDNLDTLSPLELFEKLMTPGIYEHIVKETVRYASSCKNMCDFTFSVDELKTFIGILLFSGYHKVPSERDYWSSEEDLGVPIIQRAMSRNRYQLVKSLIHFCNNEDTKDNTHDKGFKIRSLLSLAKESFQQFGIFEEFISVDEMMVKYYGRNSLKQFMRGKPIRFGYKFWAAYGASGYCYNFDMYCGKSSRNDDNDGLLLGTKVVLRMLEAVKVPNSHSVFFDNFFTGYDLWSDNKCVCVGTNYDTIEPVKKVKRWQIDIKAKGDVPQPNVLNNYNAYMGGDQVHMKLLSCFMAFVDNCAKQFKLLTDVPEAKAPQQAILKESSNSCISSHQVFRSCIVFLVQSVSNPTQRIPQTLVIIFICEVSIHCDERDAIHIVIHTTIYKWSCFQIFRKDILKILRVETIADPNQWQSYNCDPTGEEQVSLAARARCPCPASVLLPARKQYRAVVGSPRRPLRCWKWCPRAGQVKR
ncbi:uncharacterized protein LOC143028888 [Oratosquilla oratoria]|uniref:uncharacterized protein LOC143028888 n=1 Tax=Oratosquilla oratoria TaxID=337810 RepID=UPI003F769C01